MAAAVGRVDELVKDYLLFRGFTSSLKSLEAELKNDKDKTFRADKMLDQLTGYVHSYDLSSLREYWAYLDQRLFSRLELTYAGSIRKLEVSLFKYYLVYSVQNGKHEKVTEFFEKMSPELQNQPEWKEWFVLPFIKGPEDNSVFAMFFTRQWQETFLISLHNFLSVIIQCMPVPPLLSFEEDARKIAKLQEINNSLRQQLSAEHCERDSRMMRAESEPQSPGGPPSSLSNMDLMDDFFVISQDTTIHDRQQQQQQQQQQPKTAQIRSFIKNIGLPSSPIMGKKSSPQQVPTTNTAKKPLASTQGSGSAMVKDDIPGLKTRTKDTSSLKLKPKSVSTSGSGTAPSSGTAVSSGQQEKSSDDLPEGRKKAESHVPKSLKERSSIPVSTTGHAIVKGEAGCRLSTDGGGSQSRPTGDRLPPEGSARRDMPSSFAVPGATAKTSAAMIAADVPDPSSSSSFLLLSQEEYGEHHSAVTHCRFSSTGHTVATADVDGVVKLWTLQPSPVTLATIMSKSTLLSLEWVSKTDRWLLLGSKSGTVRVFDVKEKKTIKEASVDAAYPRIISLACSPSGTSFACSAAGRLRPTSSGAESSSPRMGKLSLWDLKSMKTERYLPLTPGPVAVNCTSFNHNGNLLVTGGADGIIRVFDLQKHESLANWPAHSGEVYSVQFSSDETACYSMGSDGKFVKWSIHKMGCKLSELKIHSGACGPFVLTGPGGYRQVQTPKGKLFAFDTEGQHVLTCAQNGGVIYKLDKDCGIHKALTLGGHKAPVVSVDWSSSIDCRMCLTGSMDGRVNVATLLAQ